MNDALNWLSQHIVTIASVLTAVCTVGGMLAKFCRTLMKPINEIKRTNALQTEKLDKLTDDVARLQGDRLNQAYDFYMAQGWCSGAKKRQLQDWHSAYTKAGHNHLADHYLQDLLKLPERPTVS